MAYEQNVSILSYICHRKVILVVKMSRWDQIAVGQDEGTLKSGEKSYPHPVENPVDKLREN